MSTRPARPADGPDRLPHQLTPPAGGAGRPCSCAVPPPCRDDRDRRPCSGPRPTWPLAPLVCPACAPARRTRGVTPVPAPCAATATSRWRCVRGGPAAAPAGSATCCFPRRSPRAAPTRPRSSGRRWVRTPPARPGRARRGAGGGSRTGCARPAPPRAGAEHLLAPARPRLSAFPRRGHGRHNPRDPQRVTVGNRGERLGRALGRCPRSATRPAGQHVAQFTQGPADPCASALEVAGAAVGIGPSSLHSAVAISQCLPGDRPFSRHRPCSPAGCARRVIEWRREAMMRL